MRRPVYGRSLSPFQRLFEAEYHDKLSTPKRNGRESGNTLPSARKVTNSITDTDPEHTKYFTALFTTMGQFIDHDLTLTPMMRGPKNERITCCQEGDRFKEVQTKAERDYCFPIMLEGSDE